MSLVFLLLVTLIGLVAMRTTNLEESMANNAQDRMLAFQAAEAALRQGEALFTQSGNIFALFEPDQVDTCCPAANEVWQFNAAGLYGNPPNPNTLSTQDNTWWAGVSRQYGQDLDRVDTRPRYIVEFQAYVPHSPGIGHAVGGPTGLNFYRISAHGTGMTDDSQVVVQSSIAKPYN